MRYENQEFIQFELTIGLAGADENGFGVYLRRFFSSTLSFKVTSLWNPKDC